MVQRRRDLTLTWVKYSAISDAFYCDTFFVFKEVGEIQMNEDALVACGVVVNASEIFGLYGYPRDF